MQGFVHGLAPLHEDGASVAAQAALREAGELLGDLDGAVQGFAVFGEAVGQAHAQRFFATDAASGEDHVHGVALADQPWQAHGAAVHQGNAPAPAVDAEDRGTGRDAHVAPQRQLQAASHGVALDRGDHGLREHHAGGAEGAVAFQRHAVAASGRDGLQIRTGAEVAAGAGEHGGEALLVRVEGAERFRQARGGLVVHGVAHRRAVDADHQQVAVFLRLHCHLVLLSAWWLLARGGNGTALRASAAPLAAGAGPPSSRLRVGKSCRKC